MFPCQNTASHMSYSDTRISCIHKRGCECYTSFTMTLCWVKASQVVLVVKNLPISAGDERDGGSFPGSGASPGAGSSHPLQYSCLENSMDRGAWEATGHEVAKRLQRVITEQLISAGVI